MFAYLKHISVHIDKVFTTSLFIKQQPYTTQYTYWWCTQACKEVTFDISDSDYFLYMQNLTLIYG